ncbi:hypothetical protein AB0H69_04680 [Streptomyces phaeochromogenes]|uniref:hypothetical protein n=1 Tax=Streptomyces phaeochromogenes TaxID=1923 RepID=UPI0033F0F9B1
MTDSQDRQIVVAAGPVDVLHRLALAIRPLDARTRGPAGPDLRVGLETAPVPGRRMPPHQVVRPLEHHGATGFVVRHGTSGVLPASVAVRVDDPARRWIPRKFSVPLWTRAELALSDAVPPGAPHVPAASRLLLPWLLPGPAYSVAPGTTGMRLRVTRAGDPVRWPRVTAYGSGGILVGWAHGDEHGEVLLLLYTVVPASQTGALVPVALRTHAPDPATAPSPDPLDPPADLVVEAVARSHSPPEDADLDNPVLRGTDLPPGYQTGATDTVREFTVGQVVHADDLPHTTA